MGNGTCHGDDLANLGCDRLTLLGNRNTLVTDNSLLYLTGLNNTITFILLQHSTSCLLVEKCSFFVKLTSYKSVYVCHSPPKKLEMTSPKQHRTGRGCVSLFN